VLEVKLRPEPGPASPVPEAGVSIAEAARRTGVSVHTLRYYERAGLVITDVDRTVGGRRRYRHEDLMWIGVCTSLRATGMPIKTIRRYAELVCAGPGNEPERLALLEAHRAGVTAQLAELQQNLKLIDHKIDVYQGRLAAGDADRLWAPGGPPVPAQPPHAQPPHAQPPHAQPAHDHEPDAASKAPAR
jgi:DNA-binding transcriptional MerR regulator